MTGTYVHYPPGLGCVQIPSRRGMPANGALLYPACTRLAVAGHGLAWFLLRLTGARLLPGVRGPLTVPGFAPSVLEDLWEHLRADLGTFDSVAVAVSRQASRKGCMALLTRGSRTVAVVKVRHPGATGLQAERVALESCERHASTGLPFLAPRVVGHGAIPGADWLALSPLPPRPHRPAWNPPLDDVLGAVGELLADAPVGPPAPDGWRRMHGDLTPWNLRRVRGRTWLLDWEGASFAPPHADAVYWSASLYALRRGQLPGAGGGDWSEASAFWLEVLGRRSAGDLDGWLNDRMRTALEAAGGVALV